ncbi:MAG: hypothetical protein EBR40_00080 [Proteobacteria bacterium]|nr:hypothetical protein [Pseudomonadota bacterium]
MNNEITDKCPHCGAEKKFSATFDHYGVDYEFYCETQVYDDGTIAPSSWCEERGEHNKTKTENAKLRKLLEVAIEVAEDALEERDLKRRIADEIGSLKAELNRLPKS